MNPKRKQPKIWCVTDPEALVWEHMGEESVLLDRRSGQTHLLTQLTAECLAILQDRAMSLEQLCESLGTQSYPENEIQARIQIGRLLTTLDDLGLIVPVAE